jgi:hypothetical protein
VVAGHSERLLVLRASGQRPAFGFDWLCFPAPQIRAHLHNPFPAKHLHSFGLLQIGFVFSNHALSFLDAESKTTKNSGFLFSQE